MNASFVETATQKMGVGRGGWWWEGGGDARFEEILFFHRLLTFSVALVMSRRGRG